MQTWFDEFNEEVFRNELPTVKITFTNTRRQLGQFYWGPARGIGIKISLFWDRNEEQYRNTLLHEMCHLYCYHKGFIHEGHGSRWKQIAAYATRVTGLKIQRCEDITGWEVSAGNEAKEAARKEKKDAPGVIVDLEYDTYHFLVKISPKTLRKVENTTWDNKIRTNAKSYRVVLSDAPLFKRYQTSRSIHRGYRYDTWKYEKDIKPLIDKSIEVDELHKLFRGDYDFLGIR